MKVEKKEKKIRKRLIIGEGSQEGMKDLAFFQ